MRTRYRLSLTAIVASFVLAAAVATSSATYLFVSQESFRAVWSTVSFVAGGHTVRCAMTLQGTFASGTFAKTNEARVASVTGASFGTCTGGSSTMLTETLPWNVQYAGFTGTLPTIRAIKLRVVGFGARIQPTGLVACLARSTTANPLITIAELGGEAEVSGLAFEPNARIPLEGFLCEFAGEADLEGTATVTRLGETATVQFVLGPAIEEEVRGNLPDVVMERNVIRVVVQIRNKDVKTTRTIQEVRLVGNEAKFRLNQEAAESCRRNVLLAKKGEARDSCTLDISYVGRREERKIETTVEIRYTIGPGMKQFPAAMKVIAER